MIFTVIHGYPQYNMLTIHSYTMISTVYNLFKTHVIGGKPSSVIQHGDLQNPRFLGIAGEKNHRTKAGGCNYYLNLAPGSANWTTTFILTN